MTEHDREVVSAVRARLADRIGWQRYELWFSRGTRFTMRDSRLTVASGASFSRDWLRTHFRTDLEEAAGEVIGTSVTVEFRIDEGLATPPPPAASRTQECPPTSASATRPPKAPLRRQWASMDRYAVGAGNKLAFTSAELAIDRPGNVSPLVIHGPTGVGKTHLLEAVYQQATSAPHHLRAVYLTAEQFTTDFMDALSGKGLPNFRRKYRGVDLLIIDDVQFFVGKRATLSELQYTIDTLLRNGKQLIFAADRPPSGLGELGSEIVARLTGGLVCKIEAPDLCTRRQIVAQLCESMEVELASDVKETVAERIEGDGRALRGAISLLHATSLAEDQPITRSRAEEAVSEIASRNHQLVGLKDIQRVVCQVFGIAPSALLSDRKSKAISHPRMLAMWLARKHTRAALSEISEFFGRRSHSTVIAAQKKVQRWMSQRQTVRLAEGDWQVEDAIRRVELKLRAG